MADTGRQAGTRSDDSGANPALHSEVEAQFSDLYEGSLSDKARGELEAHLASCESCRAAYDEFRDMVGALADLHKMAAPQHFERDVAETIRRRSGGRFFGRKAFGDRVPFEVLAIAILCLGLVLYAVLRSSRTGSLRYDTAPPAPAIAPGAKDAIPQPMRP